jgi:hypothetical protein
VFNRPSTNQFYISGSNDITFDALDFASAESNYEPIVRLMANHGELLIFKETVTEIWRASGDVDFPFARDTNAAIEQGCAAPRSAAAMDNTVFWLGKNREGGGIVWRLNGYTPQRVSTDAIEYAIASYPTISDAIAYSYQQEGHTFYVLTFPSGNATWVYDAATQLWHQRAYLDPGTGTLGRHRSNCHMYFAGLHVVGDCITGDLYALDLDYFYDRASDPMPAIRAAPHIADGDYLDRAQPPAGGHGDRRRPGQRPGFGACCAAGLVRRRRQHLEQPARRRDGQDGRIQDPRALEPSGPGAGSGLPHDHQRSGQARDSGRRTQSGELMPSKLNVLPVRVPIGRVDDANGTSYDVFMTPEFARAMSDLMAQGRRPDQLQRRTNSVP